MSQTQQEVRHADSIASGETPTDDKDKKKIKSRRPPNTAFRQQRLKAWQPILTPKTVLPLFFAVGIIFAPIGGLLLWASSQVEEISIDYSGCSKLAGSNFADMPAGRVTKHFKALGAAESYAPTTTQWKMEKNVTVQYPNGVTVSDTNQCSLRFSIDNDMQAPVLFYYQLTNFYQNHRRYVKSFDANQLKGVARTPDQINHSDCDPIRLDPNNKPYYPCGLIANSFFNDTFHSLRLTNADGGGEQSYNMSTTGIAWSSDKDLYKKTSYHRGDIVPPPNWIRRYPNYTDIDPPDLSQDEAFQVWMRTAGLPAFSKLAMRNNKDPMSRGTYQVDIWDEFDVTLYGGTKSILISTRTVMGGKNPFLGIAYIVVGGLCILLGALFTATHIIKPRKLGDHTYLSWDKEPTQATTTGSSARPGETTA